MVSLEVRQRMFSNSSFRSCFCIICTSIWNCRIWQLIYLFIKKSLLGFGSVFSWLCRSVWETLPSWQYWASLVHKHHSIPPQIGLLSLSRVLKFSVSGLSICQIYSWVLHGFYAVNDIKKFLFSVSGCC